jgi:hypothetical protein
MSAWKRSDFYKFVARVLVFFMVIQGLPLWDLSQAYKWEYQPQKLQRILDFLSVLGPASAEAAPPRVVCVPQLPSDLLVPHETWSGETTILKGMARDDDGDLTGGSYYWEFGDGGVSLSQSITDPHNLAATHTYVADPGTLLIARLNVTDAAGETSSDEYRVLVKERTLDVEVNKAIDDGLWWLYTYVEETGSYEIIPSNVLFTSTGEQGLQGEYYNNRNLSGDPVLIRTDPEINFDWAYSSPGAGVNSDFFSVRWTGEIEVAETGDYLFSTANDDGVRLYIDGNRVIDDWRSHYTTWNYSVPIYLSAGRHEIQLEYYEYDLPANVCLYWSPVISYRWGNTYAETFTDYYANPTASAVQAFEINGHLETGDPDEDPYVDVVRGGIDYLLTTLSTYNMSLQGGEDPDSNGNGVGLAVDSDRSIYETGAVMDAFVASGTPDAITRAGGANVLGRRYQDIVQDMVDMYAWGQVDSGSAAGGWRYSWNSQADNSASQWAAIGMIAAERHFGCTVPQWVKDRNDSWLNNSYNSAGYFGYTGTSAHYSAMPPDPVA